MTKPKVHFIFIRNIDFLLYFKDFHEMLDYLTFVSLRSHFVETNLIFLSLSQFADFVCKLKLRFNPQFFFLFMIFLSAVDRKRTVDLLGKHHAREHMRKGHFRH